MKQFQLFSISILAVLLLACSGSTTYRGAWKGMTPSGEKVIIEFKANSFTVEDSTGVSKTFEYTQNTVHIENSVKTYGISLKDGRTYQINFPIANNDSLGVIKDGNGAPMFSISRKDYVKYDSIFELK